MTRNTNHIIGLNRILVHGLFNSWNSGSGWSCTTYHWPWSISWEFNTTWSDKGIGT